MTFFRAGVICLAMATVGYFALPTEVPAGFTAREVDESGVRMRARDGSERRTGPRQAQQDYATGQFGFPPDQRLVVQDSAGQRGSIDPVDAAQAFKNGDMLVGVERIVRPPMSRFGVVERVGFMPGYAILVTLAVMLGIAAGLNTALRKIGA